MGYSDGICVFRELWDLEQSLTVILKSKGRIAGKMKFVFRKWKGHIRGHNSEGLLIVVRARKSQEKTFRKLF